MKYKYPVIVAAILLGLNVTLFADEKQAGSTAPHITADSISIKPRTPQVIRLKTNGDTIAELRVLQARTVEFISQQVNLNAATGRITANGGVTVQIKYAGSSPVEVKANEIEADTVAVLDTDTSNDTSRVIRLKAQGEIIAEVRLLKPTGIKFDGNLSRTDKRTGQRMSVRGARLEMQTGTQSISIKADEMEYETLK